MLAAARRLDRAFVAQHDYLWSTGIGGLHEPRWKTRIELADRSSSTSRSAQPAPPTQRSRLALAGRVRGSDQDRRGLETPATQLRGTRCTPQPPPRPRRFTATARARTGVPHCPPGQPTAGRNPVAGSQSDPERLNRALQHGFGPRSRSARDRCRQRPFWPPPVESVDHRRRSFSMCNRLIPFDRCERPSRASRPGVAPPYCCVLRSVTGFGHRRACRRWCFAC